MIISDHMDPVQSQLDGKYYDSKSTLRATYRTAGVREVGNDVATARKAPARPDRESLRDSVGEAIHRAGLSPDESLEAG